MPRWLPLLPVGLGAAAAMIIMAAAVLPLVTPVRTQIVTSGSMAPSIPVGALVLTVPIDGVAAPGDVILFPHPWGPATVVHRIVAVERGAVDSDYVTKGDANDREDGWRISVTAATGQVIATVPYLGYVLGTLRLPLARLGIGLLIIGLVLPTLRSGRRSGQAGRGLGHPLRPVLVVHAAADRPATPPARP